MNTLNPVLSTSTQQKTTRYMVLYEDIERGRHARKLADLLASEFGQRKAMPEAFWRSDLLEYPQIASELIRLAAQTDIIILSLNGCKELSLAVRQWLQSWLESIHSREATLVAIFDPRRSLPHHVEETCSFLKEITKGAGAVFFHSFVSLPPSINPTTDEESGLHDFEVKRESLSPRKIGRESIRCFGLTTGREQTNLIA